MSLTLQVELGFLDETTAHREDAVEAGSQFVGLRHRLQGGVESLHQGGRISSGLRLARSDSEAPASRKPHLDHMAWNTMGLMEVTNSVMSESLRVFAFSGTNPHLGFLYLSLWTLLMKVSESFAMNSVSFRLCLPILAGW